MVVARSPNRPSTISTFGLLRQLADRSYLVLARPNQPFESLALLWSKFRVLNGPTPCRTPICSNFFVQPLTLPQRVPDLRMLVASGYLSSNPTGITHGATQPRCQR